ncbi:MAG TPA: PolC-type DNA polymerase III [bacterium]|nr:PolC-type DNA polymerase III [bacterium]
MTAYRLSPAVCPVPGVALDALELDSETQRLTVRLARPIDAAKQRELCEQLRLALPAAAEITVTAPEPPAADRVADILRDNWDQLLAQLPPLTAGALRLATPQVDVAAGRLTVALDNAGTVDLLRRRGAAAQLGHLAGILAGRTLTCIFTTGADFSAQRAADYAALRAKDESAAQAQAAEYARMQKLCLHGKEIAAAPQPLPPDLLTIEGKHVVAAGRAAGYRARQVGRETRSTLHTFDLDTRTAGVLVKFFTATDHLLPCAIADGLELKVAGRLVMDEFSHEVVLEATAVNLWQEPVRADGAACKRVELHAHTQMSTRDALTPVQRLIQRAKQWGHPAIAITDHGGVQVFPEAYGAAKKAGIKLLLGIEGYLLPDAAPVAVNCPAGLPLAGLTGALLELRSTGGDPLRHDLSGYTLWPVRHGRAGKPVRRDWQPGGRADGLAELCERLGEAPVVLAGGDTALSFLRCAWPDRALNPCLDLDRWARSLAPGWQREEGGLPALLTQLLEQSAARGLAALADLNTMAAPLRHDEGKTNHIIILARNQRGLRNLYELVSHSFVKTFYKQPRIPRSVLAQRRDGLLIGSACAAGEVTQALLRGAGDTALTELARFYDYLEMMPTGNNRFMLNHPDYPGITTVEHLHEVNRRIWELGAAAERMVVVTADVHFLDFEDGIFRQVMQSGMGYEDVDRDVPLYLRTTDEMRAEFPWLDDAAAELAVARWPQRVAELIGTVKPIPDGFNPPRLERAAEELTALVEAGLRRLCGDAPPAAVRARADRELQAIITNRFADLYLLAQRLVKKSNDDGYLVGSRGSVGSSFVAYLCGITEVNPLAPHYRCPHCLTLEFCDAMPVGVDLPRRQCPGCGAEEIRDGYNIPFETFVGFEGNKTPDIDLNFSGEYQPQAHQYVEQMLGRENVFRAGTWLTIQFKNAFGYVKKYAEKTGVTLARAEERRLARGLVGVKSTNGQHPGGLVVVPAGVNINEFTPVNFPGEAAGEKALTTHFEYHAMENQLVKLDILGHDMPTMMRLLNDLTGIDPLTIPIDDPATLKLFTSCKPLKVRKADINCGLGVLGLPEFGTSFVREMLLDTKPTTIGELLLISGLSHGTDVWMGNAQRFIKEKQATLREVIALRDDIMLYLSGKGLPAKRAFEIMERVRKGKHLTPADEQEMRAHQVPEWYIESCNLIKYMFPKAHAVAYTMMALRTAYFKVHHPAAYYAAHFSIKLTEFDAVACAGAALVRQKLAELNAAEEITDKEKKLATLLEVAREFYARGQRFLPVDIVRSSVNRFTLEDGALRPPLMAVGGLGQKVAERIAAARAERPFRTVRDLRERAGVNKAQIDGLRDLGALAGLPEDDQLVLFAGADLPAKKKSVPTDSAPAKPAARRPAAAGAANQLSLLDSVADLTTTEEP